MKIIQMNPGFVFIDTHDQLCSTFNVIGHVICTRMYPLLSTTRKLLPVESQCFLPALFKIEALLG